MPPKSKKENKQVEIRLYYDERGLDRYYGLLELGELGGMWKNVAGRYEIDGKKIYAKQIYAEPEKYFTSEVLEKLDEILSTPNLDGIYIGPADLSLAIGEEPGFDKPENSLAFKEISRILEAAKKKN